MGVPIMPLRKIAGVQMNCRFGEKRHNLEVIRTQPREAAAHGARLVVFPECALTGYAFESKEEALPHAETVPGPSTEAVAAVCRERDVCAVFGLLERGDSGALFNAAAIV